MEEKTRLDKWLWAARFFKTRTLAAAAVSGGHVHINGSRAKASRVLQLGEELTIRRGIYEYVVTVRGLSIRRGPAKEAVLLYEETAASQAKRKQVGLAVKTLPIHHFADGRPSKKERRSLSRLRGH